MPTIRIGWNMDGISVTADSVALYRQIAVDLDGMATRVAELGDLLLAAHLQAAIDHVRAALVSAEI